MNLPLIWVKGCNIPPKPVPAERRPLRGEDRELIERALRGEHIPAEALEAINEDRFNNGQPYLIIRPRAYADEKDELPLLRKRAKKDFLFHQQKTKEYLHYINKAKAENEISSLCDRINMSMEGDAAEVEASQQELGKWFADYMSDNGYALQMDSTMIKQAIMTAFPTVREEKGKSWAFFLIAFNTSLICTPCTAYTPENLERALLQTEKIYTSLAETEGFDDTNLLNPWKVLTNARSAMLQQSI